MNEILLNILSVLVSAVVLPLLVLAGNALIQLIDQKVKNQQLNQALKTTVEIVEKSVAMVAQTYVDELKEQGSFDEQARQTALQKAVKNVKELLSESTKSLLLQTYSDLDQWLTTLIESAVLEKKAE